MSYLTRSRLALLAVYFTAAFSGYIAAGFLAGQGILSSAAVAVVVSVLVVYCGSFALNNSSVFDPWWSLAPPLMVVFYLAVSSIQYPVSSIQYPASSMLDILMDSPRISVVFFLTLVYGIRLTWNFLRGWPGFKHEDWRYVDFRKNSGKAYWLVSFGGIHLFPALMVFGGTLSIWAVVASNIGPLGILDFLAMLVTLFAIFLEAIADSQLRRFTAECKVPEKTMDKGLWAYSRHPNYLGEILFWWGLYLFALAANPSFWWVITGPVAITLMFLFVSIPMIEKRMLKRRKDYAEYRERVGMLLIWKRTGKKVNQ